MDDPRLTAMLSELVSAANAGLPDEALFERLRDRAGVPLWRSALQLENRHPVYYGYCLHWREDEGARLVERSRAFAASEEFQRSLYLASLKAGGSWRWRRDGGTAPGLPLVEGLAGPGVSDFLVEILAPLGAMPPGITWATRAEAGWAASDVTLLRALGPHLVPLFGVGAERRKLEAVLRTYLGAGPAREVRDGRIQRGDVRRLDAVVLLTDLAGFTAMTGAWSEASLLEALDAYFEAVADAVGARGGEVLKFIGDGVLAVFPAGDEAALAGRCRDALDAVRGARSALEAINAGRRLGAAPLAFTAVLHAGAVAYGNVGARERLDFTVIGGAVNVASRVEAVAKRLGEATVATRAVARHLDGSSARALGAHELKGLAEPVELVAL
jgi:adenylate cyclase